MTFGVLVLLGQQPDRPADLRAKEDLLGRDELGSAEVPGQGPRRRGAEQVGGNREADEQDARDLQPVPEPPAEIEIALRQGGDERGGEPHEPTKTPRSARRRVSSTVRSARQRRRP